MRAVVKPGGPSADHSGRVPPATVLPPALTLVGQLAAEHTAHLLWLRRRFPSVGEELLADGVQGAYAEALEQLRRPEEERPAFGSYDAARGWLRTIAANLVRRSLRRAGGAEPTSDEDLESLADRAPAADADLLADSAHAHLRESMARALHDLADDHARVLRWRYLDDLPPSTIMSMEGLSTHKQYEGRHRRAIEALRRALMRVQLGSACAEARVLLVREPEAYITGRRIAAHLDECVPCRAYARSLRGALAAMPLSPAAFHALTDAARRTSPEPRGEDGAPELPSTPRTSPRGHGGRVPGGLLRAAAIAGAGAAAAGGFLLSGSADNGAEPSAARPAARAAPAATPAPPRPRSELRWADSTSRRTQLPALP